uniref:Uncharacterized protein n=1 Tax=Arundo donax TaxID=35708 RepID=A0A0A9BS13_ARUDO
MDNLENPNLPLLISILVSYMELMKNLFCFCLILRTVTRK